MNGTDIERAVAAFAAPDDADERGLFAEDLQAVFASLFQRDGGAKADTATGDVADEDIVFVDFATADETGRGCGFAGGLSRVATAVGAGNERVKHLFVVFGRGKMELCHRERYYCGASAGGSGKSAGSTCPIPIHYDLPTAILTSSLTLARDNVCRINWAILDTR